MKRKLQRLVVPEPDDACQVQTDWQKAGLASNSILFHQRLRPNPPCLTFTCDYYLAARLSLAVCGIILLANGIPLLTLSRDQRRRFL